MSSQSNLITAFPNIVESLDYNRDYLCTEKSILIKQNIKGIKLTFKYIHVNGSGPNNSKIQVFPPWNNPFLIQNLIFTKYISFLIFRCKTMKQYKKKSSITTKEK